MFESMLSLYDCQDQIYANNQIPEKPEKHQSYVKVGGNYVHLDFLMVIINIQDKWDQSSKSG